MRWGRLTLVMMSVALAGAGAWWLGTRGVTGSPFFCALNQWTGLHCPGCGMTRAAYAFLHGHWWQAFRFNPLGMVLLPAIAIYLIPDVVRYVRGMPPRSRTIRPRWPIGLAVVVIGFGVVRNLPWVPFRYLAPPESSAAQ